MRLTKIYFRKYERLTIFFGSIVFNLFVITLLTMFLSGSSNANLEVDKASDLIAKEKIYNSAVGFLDDEKQVEPVLTPIPHIVEYENGIDKVWFYADGQKYLYPNFPHEIIWNNDKPYYYKKEK